MSSIFAQEIIAAAGRRGVTTTYTELNKLMEGHPTVQVKIGSSALQSYGSV